MTSSYFRRTTNHQQLAIWAFVRVSPEDFFILKVCVLDLILFLLLGFPSRHFDIILFAGLHVDGEADPLWLPLHQFLHGQHLKAKWFTTLVLQGGDPIFFILKYLDKFLQQSQILNIDGDLFTDGRWLMTQNTITTITLFLRSLLRIIGCLTLDLCSRASDYKWIKILSSTSSFSVVFGNGRGCHKLQTSRYTSRYLRQTRNEIRQTNPQWNEHKN